MVNAWEVASIVAVVAGIVGFFTVLRGSAFAAHAIPNGSFAGAAGASLIGASTLVGLGVFALAGAIGISVLGRRARHDVAVTAADSWSRCSRLGARCSSASSTQYAQRRSTRCCSARCSASAPARRSVPDRRSLATAVCVVAIAACSTGRCCSPRLKTCPRSREARGISPTFGMELAFLGDAGARHGDDGIPVVGTLLIFSADDRNAAGRRALADRPAARCAMGALGRDRAGDQPSGASIAAAYATDYPVGFFVGGTLSAVLLRRAGRPRLRVERTPRRPRRTEYVGAREPGLKALVSRRMSGAEHEPRALVRARGCCAHRRAAGYRRGGARRAVLELLDTQECARSAVEIEDLLRRQSVAGRAVSRASIYRILDQLEALGLVARLEVGQGVVRFEAAREGVGHHHHLICDVCGTLTPFTDPELERAIEGLSQRVALRVSEHEVVLHGACSDCSRCATRRSASRPLCRTPPIDLEDHTVPQRSSYTEGTLAWVDLQTTDVNAAKGFYAQPLRRAVLRHRPADAAGGATRSRCSRASPSPRSRRSRRTWCRTGSRFGLEHVHRNG